MFPDAVVVTVTFPVTTSASESLRSAVGLFVASAPAFIVVKVPAAVAVVDDLTNSTVYTVLGNRSVKA